MPTIRESIRPILTISMAAAIVMLLLAPLEATEWASGFRVGVPLGGGEGFESGPGGIITVIAPLIKITLLMGVPAVMTLGVRRLISRSR